MKKSLLLLGVVFTSLSVFAQQPGGCIASYSNYADQSNTMRHLFFAQTNGGLGSYTYNWDFGDGTTSSSENPDHTFIQTGFYNVCLTVTDTANCTSLPYCQTLFVYASSSCLVTHTAAAASSTSSTYTFTSAAPSGNFVFTWYFGDGNMQTTSSPTTTYTYANQGSYHTMLVINDTITGCWASSFYAVNVTTGLPSCSVYFGNHPSPTNYLQNTFIGYSSSYSTAGTYLWTFGDGTSATSSSPTHTYSQAGFYNVCLTFTDINNCTSSVCYDISVFNYNCSIDYSFTNNIATPLDYTLTSSYVSPTAIYIWYYGDGTTDTTTTPTTTHTYALPGVYHSCLTVFDIGTGCYSYTCKILSAGSVGGNCWNYLYSFPDTLSFLTHNFMGYLADGSTGTNYLWDFGDGNTSNATSPTHTYTQPGIYTVCLSLTDASGCVSLSCQDLHVFNWACSTSYTTTIDSNNVFKYTFAVTNPSPTATYTWDFGNGSTDTSAVTTYIYPSNQSQQVQYVCLLTHDLVTGCIAYDCQFLFVGSANACSVMFYNSPDHYNLLTNYFYAYSYTGEPLANVLWDFGDGNTSTLEYVSHTYAQTGAYYVCVTATDLNGCTSTYCQHVYIYNNNNNGNCVATLSLNSTPTGGLSYDFSAATSIASPTYYWDFGDGNTATSTNATISHIYQNGGTYEICVYAYESSTGCHASYCDSVTILFTTTPCQTAIQFVADPINLNTYNFNATTTGVAPFSYAWDFGDGNTSTAATPDNTYPSSGANTQYFNVSLTVTDSDSCVTTDSVTVAVLSYGQIISGVVAKDATLQSLAGAKVYLIEYDSIAGTLTAVDSTLTIQGFYQFSNVATGSYLVKAALLTSDLAYGNYLPTYYGLSLTWNNATFVSPAPIDSAFAYNIILIKGANPNSGPGFIGGMVVNGAGRPIINNQTIIDNINELKAMPDVSVLLLDGNDNPITHTTTAADGSYSFSNLAMGNYKVHVEAIGKISYPANITIDSAAMHHTQVHFSMHSNTVTLTMVKDISSNIEQVNIFPNPADDNLNLSLRLKERMDLTINVTNLLGQRLISENISLESGTQISRINLHGLPTGMYLLSLSSGTEVITYKIYKK
jgi:PKD repeat protein